MAKISLNKRLEKLKIFMSTLIKEKQPELKQSGPVN